jgi:multidrug resistance efflux pump
LLVAALDQALACVAALEAELKTTAEALKDANAAKVSADKAAKAAETKAKRAEKLWLKRLGNKPSVSNYG